MARIGIDATAVAKEGKGISRYQKNIVRALMESETDHEFFVFHQPGAFDDFSRGRSNWHFLEVSIWKQMVWEQFQLPKLIKSCRLDLMYTTSDRLPLSSGSVPFIVHLFEIPAHRITRNRQVGFNPRWYHRASEKYHSLVFPRSIRKAALVLAGSEFTKRDLMREFHVPDKKVKVVYAGCERDFKPARDGGGISEIRARASSGSPYLLHFSTSDPRDNTEMVLAAFRKVREHFSKLKLMIIGQDGVSKSSDDGSVIWRSFVPDHELIELYQAADAYVDPSLYEGFGFQPLEAMACGAPVVASNVTAIPEIVQDAGLLVDPRNSDTIAEAILKLLTDRSLQSELREKGPARAAHFSWNQTAEQALESFETVLAQTKVALLTEIISPYRIPVFGEIAKDPRIDLEVIFLAETSGDRKWKIRKQDIPFDYRVPWGIGFSVNRRFPVFFNPFIFGELMRINPDVIICGGYQHPSFLVAHLFAKLFRKRIILWSESHASSVQLKQSWAMSYRRTMIRQSSAYLVPGKLAHDFLLGLGARREQIYTAPNAVDNDFFYSSSQSFRIRKERLKKERKWSRYLILYVGLLTDAKGVGTLLDGFSQLRGREDIGLVLVGDGPREKFYREYCGQKGLGNVFFEGFKQQSELPFYYGVCDFLVMPSLRDEWGLVINEAMAAGLPVIASDCVGAATDLVEHGVNGWRFTAGRSEELTCRMAELLQNDALRETMGEHSLEIIKRYSPRRSADGFVRSILGHSELGTKASRGVVGARGH